MEWTKGKKVMAVIGGIAILFMIYGIVHFIIMNNQYNKVIEVIKQGDYTRAEEMLIDMNVKHKDDNLERSEFGRCSMLLYECEDVDNLKHYFANSDVFSKDGRLKEKNSTRSSSGSSHSKRLYGYSHGDSNHSSDSYNVHNYDDPEDFYYDNEDDFDGIDDAETYFYDHND